MSRSHSLQLGQFCFKKEPADKDKIQVLYVNLNEGKLLIGNGRILKAYGHQIGQDGNFDIEYVSYMQMHDIRDPVVFQAGLSR